MLFFSDFPVYTHIDIMLPPFPLCSVTYVRFVLVYTVPQFPWHPLYNTIIALSVSESRFTI
jgi:hypothetical protein